MVKPRGRKGGRTKARPMPRAKILDDGALMLFGVIGDPWDGLDARTVAEEIRSTRDAEELHVLINSPGGFVTDGLAIYNELRDHPGNVIIDIRGVALSMASAIAMAGSTTRMPRNGMLMIHNPWNMAIGDADDLRKAAEILDKFELSLAGIYAERTGLDEAEIEEMMTEETWLDAEEALAKGFIDEITDAAEASAFALLDVSEIKAVPDRLVALIREGRSAVRSGAQAGKRFAATSNALIDNQVTDDRSRASIIDELATATKRSKSAVRKVLRGGTACPAEGVVEGFIEVLGSRDALEGAYRADGCVVDEDDDEDDEEMARVEGDEVEGGEDGDEGGTDTGEGDDEDDAEGDPTPPASEPGARADASKGAKMTPEQIAEAAKNAVKQAEAAALERRKAIRAVAATAGLGTEWADEQIESETTIEDVRARAFEALATRQEGEGGPAWAPSGVRITGEERDKAIDAGSNWLLQKAGKATQIEKHTGKRPDGGQYRGWRLMDMARDSLERAGVNTRGMGPMEVAKLALSRGPLAASTAGFGTTSDFPVLLENALNKMLQAGYALAPTRWREFCAEGSVSDFREHKRLRRGSLGSLQDKLESGEFRSINIPDGEKGVITATTKGLMVGITRQAIVNDDVGAFIALMDDLAQSAARTIDVAVFDLIAENSGLGPTIGPFRFEGAIEGAAKTLFHADRENVDGTAAAPSVDALERMRVLMAQQQDPEGTDFLDLRPFVWVGPIGIGSDARVVVEAEFDFAAEATSTSGLFRKPNRVKDLVGAFVDTPRLTGTRYYLFADPAVAPVIEVVFLDGESQPVMEADDRIDYDGVLWLVRHDFGVGATDFRGGVTNAGA